MHHQIRLRGRNVLRRSELIHILRNLREHQRRVVTYQANNMY